MACMKNIDRRDLCRLVPGLLVAGAASPRLLASSARQNASPPAAAAPPAAGGGTLGPARAIALEATPASATANGGERRQMLHGTLATGESVELHQSMQNPGTPAPALHVIHHSEMILVREGTLQLQHEVDGKVVTETAGPGGMFYIAYGTNHTVSNAGQTQARYFVVEIGGDVK
jgi:mannose-6-phosphate isomerase-like protein (cupin superfamily)